MNKLNEISSSKLLIDLNNILLKIKQISYTYSKTSERYPPIEQLTQEQREGLILMYLALGLDIESAYEDWKKLYDEYKKTSA